MPSYFSDTQTSLWTKIITINHVIRINYEHYKSSMNNESTYNLQPNFVLFIDNVYYELNPGDA